MSKATPEAPATYFRLSDETWALIVEEYANGATAKQLGAKWKVAPNSVYRHVGEAKMTKRDCGDKRARAHAKAVTLAVKARDAKLGPRAETVEPALTTLFTTERESEAEGGDPAVLARVATLASGRAMKGRLWAEAKALAGLAESYARLAVREKEAEDPEEPGRQRAEQWMDGYMTGLRRGQQGVTEEEEAARLLESLEAMRA